MTIGNKQAQRLLLCYSSFTCIYFPGIFILLNLNGSIYNVGSYKFIPILIILMFAEVIKLSFSLLESEPTIIGRNDSWPASKTKKSWGRVVKEVCKCTFIIVFLSVAYYVLIILFGAPIFTHHEETIMLTVTLTALTFVPASLHLGVDTALGVLTGTHYPKGSVLVDAVNTNIKATLLGTWLGAVVIPLDWDRPWQVWPIPCVTGALLGYMAAHIVTLIRTLSSLKINKKAYR